MVEPVTIGVGCNKWLKDADTRMVQLYTQDYNNNWFSLHETTGGGDYQVPVGKKFIILSVTAMLVGTATVLDFTQHTVINSAGGTQIFAFYGGDTAQGQFECYATVDAGNYINVQGRSPLILIGIETTV